MDGIDRKKVDRRDRHSIRKAGSISTRQQIQTTRSKMQTELDLLMFGGEGSNSAVLGGFSGVEGGMGMGMGMGLEERVGMGMGRMAERMEALEARVAELEAQLSEKKTVAVVSTPVKKAEKVVSAQVAAPAAPVKKGKTAAPVAATPVPLDAPTPASYRLSSEVVAAHTKCQARKEPPQGGAGTGWDKRFTPSVFWEKLCQSEPEADGLCTTCLRYRDQNPKKWHGLITEEPLPESHMLGTAWAEKKCKWNPTGSASAAGSVSAPVSSAASVASEASEEVGSAVVLTPAPVSAATVAPMDPAASTAVSAAAQAKKEAAAAKRKATIAKKKEAAAATPAPVAAVAVVTLGTATAVTTVVEAAVSTTEPVADAGELKLLQGEFYWVVGSNAYEYDQIEEKPGAFAGLVRADETIDGDAEEEGAAESDGE